MVTFLREATPTKKAGIRISPAWGLGIAPLTQFCGPIARFGENLLPGKTRTERKFCVMLHPPPCARGPGAFAPTAGQGVWVLVFAGACQGTAWAGLCLIHHHHQISRYAHGPAGGKPQKKIALRAK